MKAASIFVLLVGGYISLAFGQQEGEVHAKFIKAIEKKKNKGVRTLKNGT